MFPTKSSSLFRPTLPLLAIRTHFDIFNLPLKDNSASLNTHALQKQLHQLQRQFHPDALVGKSKEEVERCETIAAQVNSAYKILKDDYSRHRYIAYCLALLKKATTSNSSSSKEGEILSSFDKDDAIVTENDDIKLGEQVPVEFLEEMLDLHEEIEDDGEDLSDERKKEMLEVVDKVAKESNEECVKLLNAFGEEFWVKQVEEYKAKSSCSFESLGDEALSAQRRYIQSLMRWTYARNLQQKIRDL